MSKIMTSTEVARALCTNENNARLAMDASGKCERVGYIRIIDEAHIPKMRKALARLIKKPGRPKGGE